MNEQRSWQKFEQLPHPSTQSISTSSMDSLQIPSSLPYVRIDLWLDISCLFKTRSEAQKACKGGKVKINDRRSKPHRHVHVGDRIVISRLHGRSQLLVVQALSVHPLSRNKARELYRDLTPPPNPGEIELSRLERTWELATNRRGVWNLDRRARRTAQRLKYSEG